MTSKQTRSPSARNCLGAWVWNWVPVAENKMLYCANPRLWFDRHGGSPRSGSELFLGWPQTSGPASPSLARALISGSRPHPMAELREALVRSFHTGAPQRRLGLCLTYEVKVTGSPGAGLWRSPPVQFGAPGA